MLYLVLHVAFTGLTMSCNSCVRAGPCLVPWDLEPRNCATIYWRLGTAGEPTLTIYTDSFLTFFILHLRPVFFFLVLFSWILKHSYPSCSSFSHCLFPKWPPSQGPIWMWTILLRMLVTARTPHYVVNFLNPSVLNPHPPRSLSLQSPFLDGSSVTGAGSF